MDETQAVRTELEAANGVPEPQGVPAPKVATAGRLAKLLGGGVTAVALLDSDDEDSGVAIVFDVFDGETKLRYDSKVDRALLLRGNKQVVALQEAVAWLFELKCLRIDGLDKDVDCGGVEPKRFFLTDGNGIILMRTATNEYLRRNRVTVGDSKN